VFRHLYISCGIYLRLLSATIIMHTHANSVRYGFNEFFPYIAVALYARSRDFLSPISIVFRVRSSIRRKKSAPKVSRYGFLCAENRAYTYTCRAPTLSLEERVIFRFFRVYNIPVHKERIKTTLGSRPSTRIRDFCYFTVPGF